MPSMRSGATMAAEEAASGEETPFTASMASANEDAASAGSRATAAASERSTTRCAASVAAASTCGAMCISVSAASEPSAAAGATSALKAWWRERLEWPYPTDEDKKALGEETGLDATQINNWFINQRKRHWHKLFARGEQAPATPEEARAALARNHGSLEKALEAARRA